MTNNNKRKTNGANLMFTILIYLLDPMHDWQMIGKSVRLFFLPTAIPDPGLAYLERLIAAAAASLSSSFSSFFCFFHN